MALPNLFIRLRIFCQNLQSEDFENTYGAFKGVLKSGMTQDWAQIRTKVFCMEVLEGSHPVSKVGLSRHLVDFCIFALAIFYYFFCLFHVYDLQKPPHYGTSAIEQCLHISVFIFGASFTDLHSGIRSCKEFPRSERSSLGRRRCLETGARKSRAGRHDWAGILHHASTTATSTIDNGDHVVVVVLPVDGFDEMLTAEVGAEVVATCHVAAQFFCQGFHSRPNFFVSLNDWWLRLKR